MSEYVQEKSLVGITNDSPLVEADLMTDLDFCRADGSMGMALNDSKESVLELCLFSSVASLFAAARSNLRAKSDLVIGRSAPSSVGRMIGGGGGGRGYERYVAERGGHVTSLRLYNTLHTQCKIENKNDSSKRENYMRTHIARR